MQEFFLEFSLPFASGDGHIVEILDGQTPVQNVRTIIVTFVRREETRIVFQGESFQLVERGEKRNLLKLRIDEKRREKLTSVRSLNSLSEMINVRRDFGQNFAPKLNRSIRFRRRFKN